jgi:hypothetical protein
VRRRRGGSRTTLRLTAPPMRREARQAKR